MFLNVSNGLFYFLSLEFTTRGASQGHLAEILFFCLVKWGTANLIYADIIAMWILLVCIGGIKMSEKTEKWYNQLKRISIGTENSIAVGFAGGILGACHGLLDAVRFHVDLEYLLTLGPAALGGFVGAVAGSSTAQSNIEANVNSSFGKNKAVMACAGGGMYAMSGAAMTLIGYAIGYYGGRMLGN